MRKCCFVPAMLVCLCGWAAVVGAEVLFEENWDMGIVPSNKWDREGDTSGPFVFDLGLAGTGDTGDYGLYLADGSYTYAKGLRSKQSFSRVPGKLLVCTFTLFRDHASVPVGYEGPCGPWVDTNILSGTYPALEQIEAGISRHDLTSDTTDYVEGSPVDFTGIDLSSAFNTAFKNATHKISALVVRVSLGPTAGALMEWAMKADVLADPNFNDFTIEYNTLAETGGSTPGYGGTNLVSSADPVWVFFAGAGEGTIYGRAIVDDIKVETRDIPCLYDVVGDINDDCKVDMLDMLILADRWLLDCVLNPDDPDCLPM